MSPSVTLPEDRGATKPRERFRRVVFRQLSDSPRITRQGCLARSVLSGAKKKKRVAEMSATQTSSHSSYTRSPTSKWLKRVKRDTTCCSRPSSTAVHSVGLVSPSLLQLLSDNGSSMPSVTLQQFPCSGYEEEVALGLDAPFILCCSEQLLAKFRCVTGQSTNPNAPDTQKLAWHKRQEETPECDGTRR